MEVIESWITSSDASQFYQDGYLTATEDYLENQFVVFKIIDGQGHILTRHKNGKCCRVKEQLAYDGTKARNMEQRLALDLLFDPTIELAIMTGIAGCGKTFLAWASGLQLVEMGYYEYLVIGRPMQEGDESLGTLPGDIKEKYTPYLAPFWDQMSALTSRDYGKANMEVMLNRGKVELLPLSLIKGRNLDNAFVILDEAEDMTIGQIQQAITRIHNPPDKQPRTKLVLTGDLSQIDRRECRRKKPPLEYTIEYFEGEGLFGHIDLKESQRGRLAQLGAGMLRDYND